MTDEESLQIKGKKYQLNKTDLVAVIQVLFKEPNIRFENGQVVWLALNDYRNAQPINGFDFAHVWGGLFNPLRTFCLAAADNSNVRTGL